MTIPDTFQFSQNKLQDYVECARRFQLRHVLMQPWPALISEPPWTAEQQLQRGADFHRLAHQYALGLEPEQLAATIHDDTLAQWWQTFLDHPPADLPTTLRRPELIVTAPLAGYRLLAKFDLLAVDPGQRIVIVDWKTSLTRPARTTLERRLQTRIYRYLAVEATAEFNGGQLPEPDQVAMIYWFANDGGSAETFFYDAAEHAADRQYLSGLISEIASREQETWPLTTDVRRCRFCNYRSLCERGVKAGFLADMEHEVEIEEPQIDLEQIAEIEF